MVVDINIKHICYAMFFFLLFFVSDSDVVWVFNELVRQVVLRASLRPCRLWSPFKKWSSEHQLSTAPLPFSMGIDPDPAGAHELLAPEINP